MILIDIFGLLGALLIRITLNLDRILLLDFLLVLLYPRIRGLSSQHGISTATYRLALDGCLGYNNRRPLHQRRKTPDLLLFSGVWRLLQSPRKHHRASMISCGAIKIKIIFVRTTGPHKHFMPIVLVFGITTKVIIVFFFFFKGGRMKSQLEPCVIL